MHSEGYCSRRVCLSVKSNLISGESVRPEDTLTHSAGNEGQKVRGVFSATAMWVLQTVYFSYRQHCSTGRCKTSTTK